METLNFWCETRSYVKFVLLILCAIYFVLLDNDGNFEFLVYMGDFCFILIYRLFIVSCVENAFRNYISVQCNSCFSSFPWQTD